MTTLAVPQSLIAQGESETLELKRSTAELRADETRCAFFHGEGGKALIGGSVGLQGCTSQGLIPFGLSDVHREAGRTRAGTTARSRPAGRAGPPPQLPDPLAMRPAFMVTYDIRDPKRLRRVYKTMCGFGEHLQLSVFRCELNKRELIELRAELGRVINHELDQVLFVDIVRSRTAAPAASARSASPTSRQNAGRSSSSTVGMASRQRIGHIESVRALARRSIPGDRSQCLQLFENSARIELTHYV